MSANGVTYPEFPLLVYKFDGSRRLIDVERIASATLPLQRLPASDTINVRLAYRHSDQVAFNLRAATDAIQGMIPGATLISPATQPFVNNVLNFASAVFSLAASQTTNAQVSDQMSPYGSVHAKTLTFELANPDGSPFGTINLGLLATPTLQRAASPVVNASTNDFAALPGENATTLAIRIGGVPRNLITELKGLPEFVRMSRERTVEAVGGFCQRSRDVLETNFNLTIMDRSLVIRQALRDTDATLADAQWYFSCYDDQERIALQQAIGLRPTPPAPPAPSQPDPAGPMPRALKDALGCLMTAQTGNYCTTRAPNARATVLNAMSEQVRIGQMDFTGLIDIATLDPSTRLVARERLVELMAGKAESFSCYARGLYLGVDDGNRGYNLTATVVDGKITGIQTVAISGDELRCT